MNSIARTSAGCSWTLFVRNHPRMIGWNTSQALWSGRPAWRQSLTGAHRLVLSWDRSLLTLLLAICLLLPALRAAHAALRHHGQGLLTLTGGKAFDANLPKGMADDRIVQSQLWQTCSLIHPPPSELPPLSKHGIRSLHVIGERHSGTHAMEGLLLANFALPVNYTLTAHKHWMQPDPPQGQTLQGALVILMVRNAYDWLKGMYNKCWHCEALQGLPFEDFLAAEVPHQTSRGPDVNLWAPKAGAPSAGSGCTPGSTQGCTGFGETSSAGGGGSQDFQPFRNVVEMRRLKVCQVAQTVARLGGALEVVRQEDILWPHQQVEVARRLQAKYSLPLFGSGQEARQALARRLGERYKDSVVQSWAQHEGKAAAGSAAPAGQHEAAQAPAPAAGLAGGGANGIGSSSTEPAGGVRPWLQYKDHGARYSPDDLVRGSLYFKGALSQVQPPWQERVQAANAVLDWRLEAALGYAPLLPADGELPAAKRGPTQ